MNKIIPKSLFLSSRRHFSDSTSTADTTIRDYSRLNDLFVIRKEHRKDGLAPIDLAYMKKILEAKAEYITLSMFLRYFLERVEEQVKTISQESRKKDDEDLDLNAKEGNSSSHDSLETTESTDPKEIQKKIKLRQINSKLPKLREDIDHFFRPENNLEKPIPFQKEEDRLRQLTEIENLDESIKSFAVDYLQVFEEELEAFFENI
jgi:hypothetical protein